MNTFVKRKDAAKALSSVRSLALRLSNDGDQFSARLAEQLKEILQESGIAPAEKCHGEAHSNGFIDHCAVCLKGDWGVVAPTIKIT